MRINKIETSKFNPSVFDNLTFGNTFGDHMLVAQYKNGKWEEPSIKPFQNISVSPAMQGVHYGQAIFEGMKAYKAQDNEVYLFRPEKNFERFNKSAQRLNMPPVPEEIFMKGLHTLIDLDRDWVPPFHEMSLYIRPVMFATEPMISARASEEYMFIILTCPAPAYYNKSLHVKIAQHYSRAAGGGVGFAKAAGNYAASFYPTNLAREEGYDQIIWTDSATHTYIEEAGTMNVFVRIGNELLTAPISERILNGITRNSAIEIAKSKGITVTERKISINEMYENHKKGNLLEVFGCGTAVVLNTFSAIGYPQEKLELKELPIEESYGKQIKKQLIDIQYAKTEDPFGWRTKVEKTLARV